MTDKIDPLPVPEVEAMVERIAALLYEEATDDPWIIAGIEHPGPDRDYYRGLASKVAALITQHQHQEQAVAWRATREGLRPFVSDTTFRRFSPEVQRFYEPYKCRSCRDADAAIEALRAKVAEMREALKDADNELDWLDEDIDTCDHSVGVCTCSYWDMRRKMKAALKQEPKP